ncbi:MULTISPECIES: hypothetical protein [Streptomyces]|uniref:hypothetical protein n=1 Tax=Streptomyces TaxID=1883 RepID=UPI001009A01A|nr:hypothetical protein [Streptomyces roseicoloratus]
MVTELKAARKPRTPSLVPPWSRLLWLGALLFGLLYAHGLHGDSSAGHIAPGSVAAAPTAHAHEQHPESGYEHDGGEESAHAVQDCATGQPTTGVDIIPPAVSILDTKHALAGVARTGAGAAAARPMAALCPSSVVLRI